MAVEPWNKVDIPLPSAASNGRITFTDTTASTIESVLSHCDVVLKLLGSQVLWTEVRVLYEIVYVVNNSLRQHKPFRALKQVEQCTKRLNKMKLQEALQDLQELCPNKIQRDMGVDIGHCSVPSQPTLEWLCLKLLGAYSLLVRTVDQCTKAFSPLTPPTDRLVRRHLCLAEFIVLNLVLASMLSRLWVYFRGILGALVPLYKSCIELHKQVARCWPMAYLTDFTLPGDLESVLSPSYSYLLTNEGKPQTVRIKKVNKFSVLDKLFKEGEEKPVEEDEGEEREVMQMLASEGTLKSSMDLGMTILRKGPYYSRKSGSSSGLDIKSMLQRTHGVTKQFVAGVFEMASSVEENTSDPALDQQKMVFIKLLKDSSSFREMAVQLKKMMDWCKKSKLRQERRHLANILLLCRRMTLLDYDGIRLQKKLRRTCKRIQRVMFRGTVAPVRESSFQWRNQSCFRSRFTTLARYGSVRNRFRASRTRSHTVKDLFGVTAHSSQTTRKNICQRDLSSEQFRKEKALGSEDIQETEVENSLQNPSSMKEQGIDDIFALIGF
ncbi:hypothetical protein NFI96_030890 [Prochilodus magdalenae]|nr:hypothetical protein NFI96_030890 [Prochilodus magdalenae]